MVPEPIYALTRGSIVIFAIDAPIEMALDTEAPYAIAFRSVIYTVAFTFISPVGL